MYKLDHEKYIGKVKKLIDYEDQREAKSYKPKVINRSQNKQLSYKINRWDFYIIFNSF